MAKHRGDGKLEMEGTGKNPEQPEQASDQPTILAMRSGLERLDRLDSADDQPDLSFFLQQVKEVKAKNRKKLIKELAILWSLALVIIALWTAAYFHSPTIFLILQGVAAVTLPVVVYVAMKKEVNKPS